MTRMRELHLFAGAGGGILGGMLLGHTPVCAVELDAYCRKVLAARQADGWLPKFPIYEDVRQFDGKPWRGRVDVVAGGFPCQPWFTAGKRKGTDDPRHLWPEMARIVEEVRPRYVFAENVQLDAMREPWRDLRGMGYRVPPALCVAAEDVGAPHLRKRWWLLAADADSGALRDKKQRTERRRLDVQDGGGSEPGHHGGEEPVANTDSQRRDGSRTPGQAGRSELADGGCARADADSARLQGRDSEELPERASQRTAGQSSASTADADSGRREERAQRDLEPSAGQPAPQRDDALRHGPWHWWQTEPPVGRVVDGLAHRVDRLRALGNGQVPMAAATAWHYLMEQL